MKKINILSLLALLLLVFACAPGEQPSGESADEALYNLVQKWESEPVFITAESALYDAESDLIYVSNIEEDPWVYDAKGSIGKLSLSGSVIEAAWVEGLNAPKGMGIFGEVLYVTDIGRLIALDRTTGDLIKIHEVEGSKALNDVTIGRNGTVFFTDSELGIIYKLEDGKISKVAENLKGSNGILAEEDHLIFGTWGDESLNRLDLATGEITIIADAIPQPDGVEAMGNGEYLVSSWKGLVHHVSADGSVSLLLDTSRDSINAADIEYIKDKNLLLVPTFFKNSIVAYQVQHNK